MQQGPLSCWQCGTVLSAAGGRCPACGAEQPPEPAPNSARITQSPGVRILRDPDDRERSEHNRARRTLPWIVLAVGLTAIGLVGVLLSPHGARVQSATASSPKPVSVGVPVRPIDPNDLGIANTKYVDPTDVLGRARPRALAWSKDAMLVGIHAQPVLGGHVNLANGGAIECIYGKPTGEGFGPGARVAGKRLRIATSRTGTTIAETAAGGSRASLEPNCPLDEAIRRAQAAGIRADAPLAVAYEYSERHQKAIWRIAAIGTDETETRTVDGWTCAILVR